MTLFRLFFDIIFLSFLFLYFSFEDVSCEVLDHYAVLRTKQR